MGNTPADFTFFRVFSLDGNIVTVWHSNQNAGDEFSPVDCDDAWGWLRGHVSDECGCQILVHADRTITATAAGQLFLISPTCHASRHMTPADLAERLCLCLSVENELDGGLTRYRAWAEALACAA